MGSCRVLTPAHELVAETVAVLDPTAERVSLQLSHDLVPGEYIVRIAFRGPINDEMRGIYRSTFRDADDREHALVTMHYEPTGARRKWPCWDEPDLKATSSHHAGRARGRPGPGQHAGDRLASRPNPGFARVRFARRCGSRCPPTWCASSSARWSLTASGAVARRPDAHRLRARTASHSGRLRERRSASARSTGSATTTTDAVRRAEARPGGHPGLRRGRDGEHGSRHVPRDRCCCWTRRRPTPDERSERGRDASPTRSPTCGSATCGDDALVERDLAQRGVRHVHVVPLRRRMEPSWRVFDAVPGGPGPGVRGRQSGDDAADRVSPSSRPTTAPGCSTS